jgi:hypothetical protein
MSSLLGPIRRDIFRKRDAEGWLVLLLRLGLVGAFILLILQPLRAERHARIFMNHCDKESICR